MLEIEHGIDIGGVSMGQIDMLEIEHGIYM